MGSFSHGEGGGVGSAFFAPGDFDGDGLPDVAIGDSTAGDSTDTGIPTPPPFGPTFSGSKLTRNAGPGPSSMVAADLNNDGTLDLAVADSGSNCITIVRNQSSAVYFLLTAQSTPVAGQPCQFVVTAINAAGQTIKNYTGTAHFFSNDPSAILPADLTLANGVGVVTATFNTLGAQYLQRNGYLQFQDYRNECIFLGCRCWCSGSFCILRRSQLIGGGHVVQCYRDCLRQLEPRSFRDSLAQVHFSSTDARNGGFASRLAHLPRPTTVHTRPPQCHSNH